VEKTIRYISTFITSLLLYTVCAYIYLSFKGFVYENGTFTLVNNAYAQSNEISSPLNSNIAINFNPVYTLGSPDAPLTMYEISSLGCSHCADFHLNILPKIEKDFISAGKLKIKFVNFPLDRKSMQGALISQCMPAETRPAFVRSMFERQREWQLAFDSAAVIKKIAAQNGFDGAAFDACAKNSEMVQNILAERQEAIDKLKVQGTPAFLITGGGANEIMYGMPDYNNFTAYLNNRLNSMSKK
jgi:protein-disulfide isomerase